MGIDSHDIADTLVVDVVVVFVVCIVVTERSQFVSIARRDLNRMITTIKQKERRRKET